MINFATLRQKRWQYLCITTQDLLFSCALVDASYAGNVFFFLADLPARQVLFDQTFLCVPGLHLKINEYPLVGSRVSFKLGGTQLHLNHRAEDSVFELSLNAGDLKIQALLKTSDTPEPLRVEVTENDKLKTVTQKTSLLPVRGELTFKEKTFNLNDALAGLDFTNGRLPRTTQWCWAFALGRLDDKTEISFNISAGNHLGGKNENCLWIEGRKIVLPPVVFRFNPTNPLASWKIDSADGSVALQFHSAGLHKEEKNLLLVRSQFVQVCGYYRGMLQLPNGRRIEINNLPGVTENQDVKW